MTYQPDLYDVIVPAAVQGDIDSPGRAGNLR